MNQQDRKTRKDLLEYQWDLFLEVQGLNDASRRDRKAMSKEAKREADEQRRILELRHKPSYIAVEAQQASQETHRLIPKSEIVRDVDIEVCADTTRPSFGEMRAARKEFPPICAEVVEYKRRKREQSRKSYLKWQSRIARNKAKKKMDSGPPVVAK